MVGMMLIIITAINMIIRSFEKGAGRGILHNHCSRPSRNIIHCSSDEREKGWKFQFDLIFSPTGLTNQRYFITKNVAMKKFYRRE